MVNAYPDKSRLVYFGSPHGSSRSIKRQVGIVDAGALQRRDDAIELSDIRHRTDPHAIHPAARDFIVADEDLAVGAAAQPLHQALGVFWIAECAGLYEQAAGSRDGHDRHGSARRIRLGRPG